MVTQKKSEKKREVRESGDHRVLREVGKDIA